MVASKLNRMMIKGAREPHRACPMKSTREVRILDKTKPLRPAPEAAEWLVVMVTPRREADAVKALQDAGYHAWHPQMTTWITSARMRLKSKVNRPLFPRYAFVAQQEGCSKSITDCDHVSCIIGPVPRGRAADKPLLAVLSERQAEGEFDGTKWVPPFAGAELVEVTEGPFAGLHGIVAKTEQQRTLVLLQILGSNRPVEVPTGSLCKVA